MERANELNWIQTVSIGHLLYMALLLEGQRTLRRRREEMKGRMVKSMEQQRRRAGDLVALLRKRN